MNRSNLFSALVVALVAIAVSVLLLEWAAGCGESYTDSRGRTHVGECIFLER